jgi:hypothetical protein
VEIGYVAILVGMVVFLSATGLLANSTYSPGLGQSLRTAGVFLTAAG